MTPDSTHCTFCDLIRGAAEVSICHEDTDAIAFMDIQPVNNGHVLVVPREHYESLLDVPPELGMHLFKVTMQLANAVRKVTGCDDLNIVVNSGAAAGQDEPHYHVHIIPRRVGDGFDIPLPFNGSQMPDRTVLDMHAARIISALRDPMRIEKPEKPEKPENTDAGAEAAPRERLVPVPSFSESTTPEPESVREPAMPPPDLGPRHTGAWRVSEGAHGELLYEPRRDTGDAA